MWPLAVIAVLAGVVALLIRFFTRENVPPMERHARALDALRHLADDPRPAAYEVMPPPDDMPTDHVRILTEPPEERGPTRRTGSERPAAARARTGTGRTAAGGTRVGRASRGRVVPAAGIERPTIEIPTRPRDRDRDRERPAAVASEAAIASGATIASPPEFRDRGGLVELARDDAAPDPQGVALRPGREQGLAALRSRPYAVAVAAAVAATIGIVVVVGLNGRTTPGAAAPKIPAPSGSSRPAVPVPSDRTTSTSVANVVPVVSRTAGGVTVTVGNPFLLTMQTTATCWVQITDLTGHTLYTETLQPGANQPIPGSQAIVVKLGYAPAVTLSVDGHPLDLSGLAQTANITFQPA